MSKSGSDIKPKFNHKEYMMEKVSCKCGSVTARCNMSHHRKTKKHVNLMAEKNEIIELKEKIKILETQQEKFLKKKK